MYSAGFGEDGDRKWGSVMDLKQGFYLAGDRKVGCLLIHGFTSTPGELRPLGEYLNAAGFTIFGVLLPGHGTKPEDMMGVSHEQWYAAVVQGYEKIKAECESVVVIGHSLGGLLAIKLATNYPVDKLITLAAAIKPMDRSLYFAGLAKHFLKYTKWKPKTYPLEQKPYMLGYNKFPVAAVHQLHLLVKQVRALLPEIMVDTLVIQSRRDKTVAPKSATRIHNLIKSERKQVLWLDNVGHAFPAAPNGRRVFGEIVKWIRGSNFTEQ